MEDLLTYGEGLEVAERDLLVSEVGKQPQSLPDQVIAVVRDENVYRYFDPTVTQLARGDRLIVVRPGQGAALGAASRHPRRGDRLRRRLSRVRTCERASLGPSGEARSPARGSGADACVEKTCPAAATAVKGGMQRDVIALLGEYGAPGPAARGSPPAPRGSTLAWVSGANA